jgi:hypothetical protein
MTTRLFDGDFIRDIAKVQQAAVEIVFDLDSLHVMRNQPGVPSRRVMR